MNKDDIIRNLAMEYGLTKKEAENLVIFVFDSISERLEKGEVVRIAEFGKFEVHDRKSRIGVNPITKEPMPIKALNAVTFHVSQSLRDKVNKDR